MSIEKNPISTASAAPGASREHHIEGTVVIADAARGESLGAYLDRTCGGFERSRALEILGAANAFKEGDATIGVGARDEKTRAAARELLAQTPLSFFSDHTLLSDSVSSFIESTIDPARAEELSTWTLGELKAFLLNSSEEAIKAQRTGLGSDVIGSVAKIMSNDELAAVGSKIFNPLPGTHIGERGYLSARVQPNSPTDNVDDIVWQVFNAFSYAVGDVVLGTNPVSSRPEDVARVEHALKDIVKTFELDEVLPWCVLSHIDVQAEVEAREPGSVHTMFQSIGGCDGTNKTFGLTTESLREHAKTAKGLYFETGQGADFTNEAGDGLDMVLLESRKYGLARALSSETDAFVHVNDVAGFIGPEVFKTKEQLVRCCLEDIVMAKLHGLCFGLDVCATLHMSLSPADLDWCLDAVMAGAPAYLMALPTKNDPMLSYMTTGYQDHVRLREQHGLKIDDRLWAFYQRLGVVDDSGRFTEHAGDSTWVYLQYRRAKGDPRTDEAILDEGRATIEQVESRDVPIAQGHGEHVYSLRPDLERELWRSYQDAQASLIIDLDDSFVSSIDGAVRLHSTAIDRIDHNHTPKAGEKLSDDSIAKLDALRKSWGAAAPDVVLMVSDGLNARAVMDPHHLAPYLVAIRTELGREGLSVAREILVLSHGRVRAGYQAAELLFAEPASEARRGLVHFIGERPGTRHQNASVYVSSPTATKWAAGDFDHNETRVVSGISDTALLPERAAALTRELIRELRVAVH
ncbi:MAG: ethanolamine ammonia-lyase subunit EutB [Myxococcota bacterium]